MTTPANRPTYGSLLSARLNIPGTSLKVKGKIPQHSPKVFERTQKANTTMSSKPGIHSFTCPGITLSYTIKGFGQLLIIQAAGWGISSQYLQIGLQPLEAHFTLVYPEPRGSGGSSRPENLSDMSSADMANDIERLRQHLGLEKIDLLGHSNGGTIALDYAERYPDKVQKLLLLTHDLYGYDDSANWQRFIE